MKNKVGNVFIHLAEDAFLTLKRMLNENYTYRVAALAYTTLLSLVPLLAVIVFFIAWFPIFSNLILLAENYVFSNFIPASASSIVNYFQKFVVQATQLPTVSITFLFITSLLLINTVAETISDIWTESARRQWSLSFLMYALILVLAPFIIGLSVFLTVYVTSLSWVVDVATLFGIREIIVYCLSLLLNALLFSFLYTVIPNEYVSWRDGLTGGMIAAILFELSKIIFSYYLSMFPSYFFIYGVFAVIPIFLIWLYIFWFIVLFGAFMTHAQSMRYNKNK